MQEHHASIAGVWLARWTKASGGEPLAYAELVEEALCFGWIDGLVNSLPDRRQVHLMTPRRRGSAWSRSNKERVARLISERRMTAAGMAAIDDARADGSWTLMDAAEAQIEPPELRAALDRNPAARTHWDRFSAPARRSLIWWVISAKRDETRYRRVLAIVAEAEHGRRAQS